MADRPIIIIGAGGHGRVVADALIESGKTVIGFTDSDSSRWGSSCLGIKILGGDAEIAKFSPDEIFLANGIGSVGLPQLRQQIFERWKEKQFQFATIIHPAAFVSAHAVIAEGSQIMAGAVIQCGVRVGDNVIVNTGVNIDHDCVIAQHSHLAPGVTLSGGVSVGSRSHIGTGAVFIQGIKLGKDCLVAAGSVVIGSHDDGVKLAGVPAKAI